MNESTAALRQTWADSPNRRYDATFSQDRKYRYALEREFEPRGEWCMFIGLNPSTADERADDPTVRREIDFAHGFGFPNLIKCNLFGLRSTDPAGIRASLIDPTGPENDTLIRRWVPMAGLIILAWGYQQKVGTLMLNRAWRVRLLLREEFLKMKAAGRTSPPVGHLGLTKGKEHQPRHPLYLPADTMWTRLDP